MKKAAIFVRVSAWLWMFDGLFLIFAVVFLVRKVWLLPVATFLPCVVAAIWGFRAQ